MTTALLCDTCNQAITDIVSGNLSTSRWENFGPKPGRVASRLGDNFKLVENNSSNACTLCSEAYRCMSNSGFDDAVYESLESPRSTTYLYTYSANTPGGVSPQAMWYLDIRGVPAAESASLGKKWGRNVNFEFYRCGAHCEESGTQQQILELDVGLCSTLNSQLGTHKINHSGSPEALELMASWSEECLRSHPLCAQRRKNPLLPTRVLDIGPADFSTDSSRYPRLLISNGRRARYASLSYRWSSPSQQCRTTQQNIHERLAHISMDGLPQSFRDAVGVVRHLGLRYLWIDCLCIVQDDEDDWKKECNRMADIFQQSFVTVSALGAKTSVSGLFRRRNTKDTWGLHIRTRDDALLGLRVRSPMLESDLRNSSMSSRGWILQEKLLSPALAHFGKRQIHWECLTGTTSELSATSILPTKGPLKYFLHETQRPGLEEYGHSHFIAWYMLIQHYSGMNLTVEADRLPAILGIARAFQQSFGATFAAGLWVEDLHRGLLWHRYGQAKLSYSGSTDVLSPTTSPTASPLWSWITLAGRAHISFEWLSDRVENIQIQMKPVKRVRSATDLQLVDMWTYAHASFERRAIKGVLQVWGVVRKARVIMDGTRTTVRQFTRKIQSYSNPKDSFHFPAQPCHVKLISIVLNI